jgi:hypothetical protein
MVKLTDKEIKRSSFYGTHNMYTVITRLQTDGSYWVAAIDIDSRKILFEEYVDSKEKIGAAAYSVNRWVDKMYGSPMGDKSRDRYTIKKDKQKNGMTDIDAQKAYDDLLYYVDMLHTTNEMDDFDTFLQKFEEIEPKISDCVYDLDEYLTGNSTASKGTELEETTIFYLSDGGYSRLIVSIYNNTIRLDSENKRIVSRWEKLNK